MASSRSVMNRCSLQAERRLPRWRACDPSQPLKSRPIGATIYVYTHVHERSMRKGNSASPSVHGWQQVLEALATSGRRAPQVVHARRRVPRGRGLVQTFSLDASCCSNQEQFRSSIIELVLACFAAASKALLLLVVLYFWKGSRLIRGPASRSGKALSAPLSRPRSIIARSRGLALWR